MAIKTYGVSAIRMPDYQEPNWHLPLNENWSMIPAMFDQLSRGEGCYFGLEASPSGLYVNISSGFSLNNAGVMSVVSAGGALVPANSQGLIVINSATQIILFVTLDDYVTSNHTPLYFVMSDSSTITTLADVRRKLIDPSNLPPIVGNVLYANDLKAIFVYDTRLDSDSGLWRYSDYTSWYNEPLGTATRGSKREFPVVALCIAQASKLTIFDITSAAMPMWMVFNATATDSTLYYSSGSAALSDVAAVNGKLAVSANYGVGYLGIIDFIKDECALWRDDRIGKSFNTIAGRNTPGTDIVDFWPRALPSKVVYNVDMLVMNDAPIDNETDLPIPSILVSTFDGMALIDRPGAVQDVVYLQGSDSENYCIQGHLDRNGDDIWFYNITHASVGGNEAPLDDWSTGPMYSFFRHRYYGTTAVANPQPPFIYPQANVPQIALGGDASKIAILRENHVDPALGMLAAIGKNFNTGFMPQDIKCAPFCTTDTGLIGNNLITNIVKNGSFDTLADWTAGNSAILTVASSKITVETGAAVYAYATQQIPNLTIGKTYRVLTSVTDLHGGGSAQTRVGTTAGNNNIYSKISTQAEQVVFEFVATTTSIWLSLLTPSTTIGQQRTFGPVQMFEIGDDLVTSGLVVAADDWTVNDPWTIGSGKATFNGAGTSADLVQAIGISTAVDLRAQFTLRERTAGTVTVTIDDQAPGEFDAISTVQMYSANIEPRSTDNDLTFTGSTAFVGSIDDVWIWQANAEILQNSDDWTGATGNTPPNYWTCTGTLVQFSVSSGILTVDRNGEALAADANMSYAITGATIGDVIECRIDDLSSAGNVWVIINQPAIAEQLVTPSGDYLFTFKVTQANFSLSLRGAATSTVFSLNKISFRKITDKAENGEFFNTRIWTEGGAGSGWTYWTISGGSAQCSGAQTSGAWLRQTSTLGLVAGSVYIVQFEVGAITGGACTLYSGGAFRATLMQNSVNKFVVHHSGNDDLTFVAATGVAVSGLKHVKVFLAEKVNGTWQPVGNLVSNAAFEGTFDHTYWTAGNNARFSSNAGAIGVYGDGATANPYIYQQIDNHPDFDGAGIYEFVVDTSEVTPVYIRIGSSVGGSEYVGYTTSVLGGATRHTLSFKYSGTGSVYLGIGNNISNATVQRFYNMTLRKISSLVENGEFSNDRKWSNDSTGTGTAAIANGVLTLLSGTPYSTNRGIRSQTIGFSTPTAGTKFLVRIINSSANTGRFILSRTVESAINVPPGESESIWTADGTGLLIPTLYSPTTDALSVIIADIKIYQMELQNGTLQIVDQLVLNPYFDGRLDETVWLENDTVIVSLESGKLRVNRNGSSVSWSHCYQLITGLEIGRVYKVTADATFVSGSAQYASLGIYTTIANGDFFDGTTGALPITTNTPLELYFKAIATSMYLALGCRQATDVVVDFNNILMTQTEQKACNPNFQIDRAWTGGGTISGGVLTFASSGIETRLQSNALEVGKKYFMQFEITAYTSGQICLYDGATGHQGDFGSSAGLVTRILEALDTSIGFYSDNFVGSVDNVYVYEFEIADESVNENDLRVYGVISAAAVASGCEMVGYQAETGQDYALQDNNSDYDYQGNECYLMCWIKPIVIHTHDQWCMAVSDASYSNFIAIVTPNNSSRFSVLSISSGGARDITSLTGVYNDEWCFVAVVRRGTNLELTFNGQYVDSVAVAAETYTMDQLQFLNTTNLDKAMAGQLCMARTGLGAPSQDDLLDIYQAELPIFQENAKCLIQGSATLIQGLQYDYQSEILWVATNDFITTFHGLTVDQYVDAPMVSNIMYDLSVCNTIAAVNTGTEASVIVPGQNIRFADSYSNQFYNVQQQINGLDSRIPHVFVSGSSLGSTPSESDIIALVGGQIAEGESCFITDSTNLWSVVFDGTNYWYSAAYTIAT